jgi:hypothetical protein
MRRLVSEFLGVVGLAVILHSAVAVSPVWAVEEMIGPAVAVVNECTPHGDPGAVGPNAPRCTGRCVDGTQSYSCTAGTAEKEINGATVTVVTCSC